MSYIIKGEKIEELGWFEKIINMTKEKLKLNKKIRKWKKKKQ